VIDDSVNFHLNKLEGGTKTGRTSRMTRLHRLANYSPRHPIRPCCEQSEGAGKRSDEEGPERAKEKRVGGAGPSTSGTDSGDAFTYLTCNNHEKVSTMARGSPRSWQKAGRCREEDAGECGTGRNV